MGISVKQAKNISSVLSEGLPYIQKFKDKVIVVKYGGAAMSDQNLKGNFARDIALMSLVGMKPVIVHGGGPQIAKELKKSGVTSNFISGHRVTDKPTMSVVKKILGKKINNEIVNLIRNSGGDAVSFNHVKHKIIKSSKFVGPDKNDLGLVGKVDKILVSELKNTISRGSIPVIAPIGINKQGNFLNINADVVAGKVAESLQAEKLILLTDIKGILNNNNLDYFDDVILITFISISTSFITISLLFLIVAAFHFGKEDTVFAFKRRFFIPEILFFFKGSSVIIAPLLFQRDATNMIFKTLNFYVFESSIFNDQFLMIILFLSFLSSIYISNKKNVDLKALMIMDFLSIIILNFFLTPILAFTLYFCFLHSIRHSISLIFELDKSFNVGLKKFVSKAIPLTFATGIMFLIAIFFLNNFYKLDEAIYKVIFIGLASLTFPHILLEYLLEKNEKRT